MFPSRSSGGNMGVSGVPFKQTQNGAKSKKTLAQCAFNNFEFLAVMSPKAIRFGRVRLQHGSVPLGLVSPVFPKATCPSGHVSGPR